MALKLESGSRKLELEKELARSLWLDRDYGEAIPLLDRLVQAEPDSPELNHELGDCLVESGEPEKAIPYLDVPSMPRQNGFRPEHRLAAPICAWTALRMPWSS